MTSRVPEAVREALLSHPELPAGDREVVERFIAWCEAYAVLEETVLGDLAFDVPVLGVDVAPGDPSRTTSDAEVLARAAASLLDLEIPVTGLTHALEMHGARVFRMPLTRGVLGAFFFAGETAPAFLINGRLVEGAARIALAHLYAHFLVDVDPYTPTVCRVREERRGERPTEELADHFAAALLAPQHIIAPFAGATETEVPLTRAVAGYLELPDSFVAARLAVLGHDVEDAPETDDWWQERAETVFPERLVALALEGIHEDKIDVEEFCTTLGISREHAIRLLALSTRPSGADESDGDGQPGRLP